MKFKVLVREHDDVYEAWEPMLHGCRALGRTEDEAIEHVKEAILREFSEEPPKHEEPQPIERSINLDIHKPPLNKKEDQGGPTRVSVQALYASGLGLVLLGITGILFYFMLGQVAGPAMLFAPMLVVALGAVGVVMGLAAADSMIRRA